jgi:hypothetical protein
MSDGNFFEKSAKAKGGRFFRDLPGRDDGNFNKAANSAYGPGVGAATSGKMGGSFGVGQSATGGGGSMYGTGGGAKKKSADSQVSKTSATTMPADGGSKKEAEVQDGAEGHGWHRPAAEQPTELEAGGSRFLQGDHGANPVGGDQGTNLQSGLHGKAKGKPMSKRASVQYVAPRFMGTSFEKRSGDPDIGGTVSRDIRGTPDAAKSVLRKGGRSAHRGAEGAWNWGKRTVSKGANTVAESPTLSLLALLGGGAMALRGGKGAAKALLRRKSRKKGAGGILAKIRKRLT